MRPLATYRSNPDSAMLLHEIAQRMDRVDTADREAGDVALLWVRADSQPKHLAVLTNDRDGIIHVVRTGATRTPRPGVIETTLEQAGFAERVHSVWRYRWPR